MSERILKYEAVIEKDQATLQSLIESANPTDVTSALYSAVRYSDDWQWIQNECLKRLSDSNVQVRWAAASCLGDLAFRRFPLDKERVIIALEESSSDPEIADPAQFSLSMIKEFV